MSTLKNNLIYKDLSEDLYEYFQKNPNSLPDVIQISKADIIGDSYTFPEEGKTVLEDWLVIFKNESGIGNHQVRYNLIYEGSKLVSARKVNSGSFPKFKTWNTNPNYRD